MTIENDFLAFATSVDANVLDQTDYAASSFVQNGFSAGIAPSNQLNKVWRQSSFVAAAIAQYIVNQTGDNVLDDGNLTEFVTNFTAAIVVGAGTKPLRLITASTNLNVLLTDYRIAWARVAAPAALTAQLPTVTNANVGQSFRLGDVQGNANAFPISVAPPAGHNIAQLPGSYVINVNRQWKEFAYCGNSTWSVE
jgi:hypothetical protein